jgi:hypothetical protein
VEARGVRRVRTLATEEALMDLNGCKPLFDHSVVVHTTFGKEFVGTLKPIGQSASAVSLVPLSAQAAAQYAFAINGVNVLDVGSIAFMQDLNQPHE